MKSEIPEIISGESASSYVYRVCKFFNFDSVFSLVSQWNMNEKKVNNNNFSRQDCTYISDFTGQNVEILHSMSADNWLVDWGDQIYNKFAMKNKIKFCPDCIQNNIMHKKIWSISPVAICSEHKTILVDCCKGCSDSIMMDDFMFGFCSKCNFLFSQSKTETIDDTSIFFQSQIYLEEVIHETPTKEGASELLSQLKCNDLFMLYYFSSHLLSTMNSFIDFGTDVILPFSNKKDRLKNQMNAATAFGNVFWMYRDFPNNFTEVLDTFFATKGTMIYIQKPTFEKLFLDEKFEMIKKAYNDFWIDKYDSGCIRKNFSVFKKEKSLINQVNTLNKDDLKYKFGISNQKLSMLRKNNLITVEHARKGKKMLYLIDRASIENVMKINELFITKREAASLLGLHSNRIAQLISSDILRVENTPTNKCRIRHRSVMKLLKICRGKYISGEPEGIQFNKALIKFSVNGLSIVKLIQFTLEGYLHPVNYVDNGTLADAYYSEDELKQCLILLKKEKQEKQGYYMEDVMDLMHIGENSMRNLIRMGVIKQDNEVILKDGRKHFLFNKQIIDSFLYENMSIEEASVEFGISPCTIRRYLKQGKLTDTLLGESRHYRISRTKISALKATNT